MTDVRLTALNPEDSQAYPVACNSSGELLVSLSNISDKYVEKSGDNMTGDLTLGTDKISLKAAEGSASFEGDITLKGTGNGQIYLSANTSGAGGYYRQKLNAGANGGVWRIMNSAGDDVVTIKHDGSASFAGDVVIGSRNKSWMIFEQSGLAHLVEQETFDAGFGVEQVSEYPKLRDIPGELDLVEKALSEVMEKLRLVPPSGWPVWDGPDETQ